MARSLGTERLPRETRCASNPIRALPPFHRRDHSKESQDVKASVVLMAICTIWATSARADPALDALVAAYPDHLARYDGNELIWKDGTRMPISDGRSGKTFDQMLDTPDIKDQ